MTINDQAYIAESRRVRLRRSGERDLDYVLEAEADPDNAAFIIRWTREEHLAAMSDESRAHWIVERRDGTTPVGYVILSALRTPHQSIEFNRITVTEKGHGYGRDVLRLIKKTMFENYAAHRLWLDVMTHNQRARGLYVSEGFVEEGCLRESLLIDGRRISLLLLSMLRPEYEKTAGQDAEA